MIVRRACGSMEYATIIVEELRWSGIIAEIDSQQIVFSSHILCASIFHKTASLRNLLQ